MKPPLRSGRGRQAFLLVEATLTAVVITVGLVWISRGLGGNLQALSRLHAYHDLLRVAESTLHELETTAQEEPISRLEGTSEGPGGGFRWELIVDPADLESAGIAPEAFRSVTLTVTRTERPTPVVSLNTLWPSEWLSE